MTNLVRPATLSNRGLSQGSMWKNCRRLGTEGLFYNEDTFFWDDFKMLSKAAPAISGLTIGPLASEGGGYNYYLDTATSACGIAGDATSLDGICRITTGATDNHEGWIQAGAGGNLALFTATNPQKMWFEARLSTAQITTTSNYFVGLGEENLAAADTITDAGAMADKDWIGFFALEAASQTLNFGYKKAGQTAQTIIAGLQTMVANTFYKVGFSYDPMAPAAQRIKVWLNGVVQTTYVTAANIAAATFPLEQKMAPLFGVKNNNAAVSAALDWWAFSQEAA
jgi:hypothetical protein